MQLSCALLCCAVLCCAVLCCAVLCCAALCSGTCMQLCCAVLCCAVLCCAVLCCAVLCLALLCPALEFACSSSVNVVDRCTGRTKGSREAADLLVLLNSAQEDDNTITAPESFISSLVHARMLLLPPAEGVGHKAVGCHAWLPFVASCQHDTADIQFPCLACSHPSPIALCMSQPVMLCTSKLCSQKCTGCAVESCLLGILQHDVQPTWLSHNFDKSAAHKNRRSLPDFESHTACFAVWCVCV